MNIIFKKFFIYIRSMPIFQIIHFEKKNKKYTHRT